MVTTPSAFRNARSALRFTDIPSSGSVFFVHSGSGSATGGYSPDSPAATLAQAIALCTASAGDTIYVMAGHAETIIAAAGVDVSKIGIRIVGLGVGRNRPVFTFTTVAGASFDVTAASCWVENLAFICGIDDQTAMLNLTAGNCVVRGCEFLLADATYDADIGILCGASADGFVIEDNIFHATGNTTAAVGISCGADDNSIIRNNVLNGYFGTAGAIANTAAAVNLTIIGNFIVNRTADGNNKAIVLHASTVGIVANNRMAVIDSTSPAPVTAAAAFVSGNYFTGAVDVTASTLM